MARLVRFVYPSARAKKGRGLYPHQLRDGDAALELMPFLRQFKYDGVFINWSLAGESDTSIAEFQKLDLVSQDLLLVTTRFPLRDTVVEKKPLLKSGTELEGLIFDEVENVFAFCSRSNVVLPTRLARKLRPEYQNRSDVTYEVHGHHASYKAVDGGEPNRVYAPWTNKMSAGYIVHMRLGKEMPRLLAVFGMCGAMTLALATKLRKEPKFLQQALAAPSVTLIELSRTGDVPSDLKASRSATLNFCDAWELNQIGFVRL